MKKSNPAASSISTPKEAKRAARILARSFYKQLRRGGMTHAQVVQVASELISCLTETIRERQARAPMAALVASASAD